MGGWAYSYIQAVSLAFIATINDHRISHQSFKAQTSNRLCGIIEWPKFPTTLPIEFITIWKAAITKIFIDSNSGLTYRIPLDLYLGN